MAVKKARQKKQLAEVIPFAKYSKNQNYNIKTDIITYNSNFIDPFICKAQCDLITMQELISCLKVETQKVISIEDYFSRSFMIKGGDREDMCCLIDVLEKTSKQLKEVADIINSNLL